MTLMLRGVQAIRGKAPISESLPTAWSSFGGDLTGQATRGLTANLTKMADSAWLFAVIDRIASAVAAAEWGLWSGVEGNATVVERHPLLDLWKQPNKTTPRMQVVENAGQHFELVGEQWWIILRDRAGFGVPLELQLIRPDRITPVMGGGGLVGYEYKIGNQRIPLDLDDVMPVLRPSPTNPFRGLGVVQSLLIELGSDKAAAQWTKAFFDNSAEPGGIVEVDREVDDAEFERFADRWRASHRGQSNAHRVAFLDNNYKWVDRKLTQRDMQFIDLRKWTRDQVLGAFGMPATALGISEGVNRANADAGERLFSRWLIVPRLRRMKAALNMHLASQFPGELFFNFVDPTPDDRVLDLDEAVRGYDSGFVMLNEARAKLELGEVPGGDEFKAAAPTPFELSARPMRRALDDTDPADLLPSPVASAEAGMLRAWRTRLRAEANALGEYLAQFFAEHERGTKRPEASDVFGYDWDWHGKHGEAVATELERVFEFVMRAQDTDMPLAEMQQRAAAYARMREGQLLFIDGPASVLPYTQQRASALVAKTLEEGWSLGRLQKELRDDFGFSPARAERVARTETATALGQGRKQIAIRDSLEEKAWFTQGFGSNVDQPCLGNEDEGWIPIGDAFSSGDDTVPQHFNCRCAVDYRMMPLAEVDAGEGLAEDIAEAREEARAIRCPQCDAKHSQDGAAFTGTVPFKCRRCNHEWSEVR